MYSPKGVFRVIAGPMSCGKSDRTLLELRRAEIARRKVLLIRPSLDTRTPPEVVQSRSGSQFRARALSTSHDIVRAVRAAGADFVAIEEGQFWDDGIVEAIETLVAHNVTVIVNGLNQDFAGRPFGPMPSLLARADEVVVLTAICMVCGADATKTQRLHADGSPARAQDPLVVIGGLETAAGEDRYEARCRSHHVVPR
jgi:thymidine kinase